jgi:hypothetical protein
MSMVPSHSFRRLAIVVGLLSIVIAGRATSAEGRETALPRTPDDQMADVGALAPEFGGIYADSDRAHLYLTDPSPAVAERARIALAEVLGADWPNGPGGEVLSDTNITIHRADYGFAQLKRWHDAMTPVLTLARVVFTDIDERANRLLVGVADRAAEGAVRNELARLGIPSAAVRVTVVPEVTLDSLQDSHTPKVGGLQITNGSGVICTLGFNARRAGVAGFVTASHCTDTAGAVEGTIFWQPGPPASCQMVCLPLAWEIADPPFVDSNSNLLCPNGKVCRYSDAAFAKYVFDSPLLFTQGHIAKPDLWTINWDGISTFAPYAKIPKATLSAFPTKVGRTTGRTWGLMATTCANVNVKNTNKLMLCQSKATYKSAPGDSGAPIIEGSFQNFLGMHWGSGGWFSDMSLIEAELGTLNVCKAPHDC